MTKIAVTTLMKITKTIVTVPLADRQRDTAPQSMTPNRPDEALVSTVDRGRTHGTLESGSTEGEEEEIETETVRLLAAAASTRSVTRRRKRRNDIVVLPSPDQVTKRTSRNQTYSWEK